MKKEAGHTLPSRGAGEKHWGQQTKLFSFSRRLLCTFYKAHCS